MVFGPHDGQRREEFILARVRAGRPLIPFGDGAWLCSRLHVADVARLVRMVVERGDVDGEVFNVAPSSTLTVREWAEVILRSAASGAELVRVPNDLALASATER